MYREDLALIHDQGFGFIARGAAATLLAALRATGRREGLIVDLGCGSGILSQIVASAGYEVLGIDLSPEMIELAQRRAPAASFHVASIFTAELPQSIAVAAVGEIINFLFDERHNRRELEALFRRIHAALLPGGMFLFDFAEPGRALGVGPQDRFFENADWTVLVRTEEHENEQELTRRIVTFRRMGDLFRRDEELHHLKLFSRAEIRGMLNEAGFVAEELEEYGDWRFPRGFAGYLARKV